MKKIFAVILATLMFATISLSLCACDILFPNDFKGVVSEKSYDTEEAAVEGFLAAEISGDAAQAKLESYTEKKELSDKELKNIDADSVLNYGDKIVSAKEMEVKYSRKSNSAKREAASEDYYILTVYVLVISPYNTRVYEYRYYVPAADNGDVVMKSYYDDLLDYEKYTNYTQVYSMTATIDMDGETENLDLNTIITIKTDGNKMYFESDIYNQKQRCYFEYNEETESFNAWVLLDGIYQKAPDSYLNNFNVTDMESFVSMNLPSLDYSFYEKTDYGFKLRDEYMDTYIADALNSTIGAIGWNTDNMDLKASLDFYVKRGRLTEMKSSIKIKMIEQSYGEELRTDIVETVSVKFTDFGTTRVIRPLNIVVY